MSGHGKRPTDRGALTSWTVEGGTCQDTERNRPTEVHSPTGDGRGRDFSRHGKKPTDRGALTNWRQQREGLGQDMERSRPTEAHSHSGDGRGRGSSGHGRKLTEQQAWVLTY